MLSADGRDMDVERIHPAHWLSMLASRNPNVAGMSLTRRLAAIARRLGGWGDDRRPRVGPVSDTWLREMNAEADKRGRE